MIRTVFNYVTPIQIYVFITLIVAILFYSPKNKNAKYLFPILFLNATTEFLSILLLSQSRPIGFLLNLCIFLHHCLWLFLLMNVVKKRLIYKVVFALFVVFALLDFFFFEGMTTFNCQTFIVGAFIYLIIFILESFYELQREAFSFFLSNQFVLLSAPVLFFIGLSAALGFQDRALIHTVLFADVILYQFIAYFVNIIYYSLIIVYIYREKRLKHAE